MHRVRVYLAALIGLVVIAASVLPPEHLHRTAHQDRSVLVHSHFSQDAENHAAGTAVTGVPRHHDDDAVYLDALGAALCCAVFAPPAVVPVVAPTDAPLADAGLRLAVPEEIATSPPESVRIPRAPPV